MALRSAARDGNCDEAQGAVGEAKGWEVTPGSPACSSSANNLMLTRCEKSAPALPRLPERLKKQWAKPVWQMQNTAQRLHWHSSQCYTCPGGHWLLQPAGQEASHHSCDEGVGSQEELKQETGLEELKGKGLKGIFEIGFFVLSVLLGMPCHRNER